MPLEFTPIIDDSLIQETEEFVEENYGLLIKIKNILK